MILIQALNYSQASRWAEEHKLHMHDWRYLCSASQTKGYSRRPVVLRIGNWYAHPHAENFEDALKPTCPIYLELPWKTNA